MRRRSRATTRRDPSDRPACPAAFPASSSGRRRARAPCRAGPCRSCGGRRRARRRTRLEVVGVGRSAPLWAWAMTTRRRAIVAALAPPSAIDDRYCATVSSDAGSAFSPRASQNRRNHASRRRSFDRGDRLRAPGVVLDALGGLDERVRTFFRAPRCRPIPRRSSARHSPCLPRRAPAVRAPHQSPMSQSSRRMPQTSWPPSPTG
jgi:hypothetical protein